jgi:hypothetical protein
MEARMPLEPALYRGGLVGGIIIDDQMQVEIGQRPLVDGLEKGGGTRGAGGGACIRRWGFVGRIEVEADDILRPWRRSSDRARA